jgi:arylformamidase
MYDLTRPLRDGGTVYPGDPPISFRPHRSLALGDPANVTALSLGTHSGTHVDAPRHFLAHGVAVDGILPERLIGPVAVLTLSPSSTLVDAATLAGHDLRGQRRVLLRTRDSAAGTHGFSTDYCALALDGAEYLLARGVELIGIDSPSVEPFGSDDYPVHRLLLEHGVVIVEGLDLSSVSAGVYDFICLPLRLEGLDGAPARAVLVERTLYD